MFVVPCCLGSPSLQLQLHMQNIIYLIPVKDILKCSTMAMSVDPLNIENFRYLHINKNEGNNNDKTISFFYIKKPILLDRSVPNIANRSLLGKLMLFRTGLCLNVALYVVVHLCCFPMRSNSDNLMSNNKALHNSLKKYFFYSLLNYCNNKTIYPEALILQ